MSLLRDTDLKQIEARIAEAEATTAAEFVVLTVSRSDSYLDVRALFAAFIALASAMLVHVSVPSLPFSWLSWVQLVAFLIAVLGSASPLVLRRIVPRARLEQSVLARAEREFLEHGIFETRARTGVLILLSDAEHRVVILGDRGIHERVQIDGWEKHVAHVTTAIARGRAADGICDVIGELGALLAKAWPATDARNELDDTVKRT